MTDPRVEAAARAIFEARLWAGAWDKANSVERDAGVFVAQAALAAADKVTADKGWKLVPIEPTEEMIDAGWIDKEDVDPDDIYGAMLAAAPLPPALEARE